MKLYSASQRGFFDPEVHGKDIPEDAVEISEEEWSGLLRAQSEGCVIRPTNGGKPAAFKVGPGDASLDRRRARDSCLAATDWLVNRHRDELDSDGNTTLSTDQYHALQSWRAQLRAITNHKDWPRVQFPPRPSGI